MIGRSARRVARTPAVAAVFVPDDVPAVLDVLELVELAWHDSYGDASPPKAVIDDILVASRGDISRLGRMGLLAVVDWRDLRVIADDVRAKNG